MTSVKILAVVIIGLLQVCTANPISSQEEEDLANRFTADELTRAKNAGIPRHALIDRMSGYTIDEFIKIWALKRSPSVIENVANLCEILVPGQKMPANYTKDQEAVLKNLFKLYDLLPSRDHLASFYRSTVCNFVINPHLLSFGPKFIPHMKIRLIKMHNLNRSALHRVTTATEMCCIDAGGEIMFSDDKTCRLRGKELNEFEKKWNDFDTSNVPESIINLCNFLQSTNAFNSYQCQKVGDLEKLFTADELTHAKNAEIPQYQLINMKSAGLTIDEIIKILAMTYTTSKYENAAKVCEILVPGRNMTSNYTGAQEAILESLFELEYLAPKKNTTSVVRTTICDFALDPHLPSSGPKFVPHAIIRLLKIYTKTDSGLDRLNLAKQMCCIDEVGKMTGYYEGNSGLRDGEMNEFEEKWNNFDTANISESIKRLCDFLHSTNTFDDDQCQKDTSFVESKL
ncbi:uncharacterized protein LOC119066536 [Bradysia coprophila]|uniref:uncharacterized protein LOC119066536 n=1 Tax=Bradysia coprophila TaxID=38358 RepID=UPI00187DA791|nr:uncharacterized protein LOC119066536 [Bradysia coprophila]